MPQKPCAFCGLSRETTESYCVHCARPVASYPNVDAAEAEADALENRYRGALQPFHTEELIAKFEELVGSGRAVMNRWFNEVYRLAMDDYEMLQPEARRVQAGLKRYRSDPKWERWRNDAASVLFPGYGGEMHFAALSLDGRGLVRYGNCRLVFRTDMISHRSTVFERNSAAWVRDQGKDAQPAGMRGTWQQRFRVAFAKLAAAIASPADLETLPSTILVDEPPDEGDDQMIEVHIWGPLTARACEEIVIPPEAYEALRENIGDQLAGFGVSFKEK